MVSPEGQSKRHFKQRRSVSTSYLSPNISYHLTLKIYYAVLKCLIKSKLFAIEVQNQSRYAVDQGHVRLIEAEKREPG